MAIIHKQARPTLTAVEMDLGDELHFTLDNGQIVRIVAKQAYAHMLDTTLPTPKVEVSGGTTNYQFGAKLLINDQPATIVREVASQRSFSPPRQLMGVSIWLDAVDDIFTILEENHGPCRPRKRVRLAVQQANRSICPVLLHPWCPLPPDGLRVEDCYDGTSVWMGAYFGASAHNGLDINHPAGTPIWAPISLDDHLCFDKVGQDANNNRWRGFHRWPDGSTWVLGVHHIFRLHCPEHEPIAAGELVADGAAVLCGRAEHSHFTFAIIEPGDSLEQRIMLDPWILFRQMYLDRRATQADTYPQAGKVQG